MDLSLVREIMGSTPFFSAGGWNDKNSWSVLELGSCDALLYGRYFLSSPDLVDRLKYGHPLEEYDRSKFYYVLSRIVSIITRTTSFGSRRILKLSKGGAAGCEARYVE
jgi:2,4-dienoyl-CoA reductase-like NADH-dependent reductase (Old Yellow Enzyme family)